jgi:hypothetical protein
MAIGKIPLLLNGSPLPAVADVGATAQRTVNQRAVLRGEVPAIVISYGPVKPSIQITFPIFEDKQYFLHATGALLPAPPLFNLQFRLGTDYYNLLNGIVQTTNPTANQDADGSIQCTVLAEEISLASAPIPGLF